MAILIDHPRMHVFAGRPISASHLISTETGVAGRAELVAFARGIGMQEKWIQRAGTPHEHFDVMNTRVNVAVAAGARQVSSRELVYAIRKKADAVRIHHAASNP